MQAMSDVASARDFHRDCPRCSDCRDEQADAVHEGVNAKRNYADQERDADGRDNGEVALQVTAAYRVQSRVES